MRSGILAIFLLGSVILLAQDRPCNYSIRGRILNLENGEPMPFATIRIRDSDLGTTSDKGGSFVLEGLCEKEVHLVISFVGFKTVVHHHDEYHEEPIIYLAPDEVELESIVVESPLNDKQIKTLSVVKQQVSAVSSLSSSTGDVLESLGGVSLLRTGQNVAKPIVHGLHSNRVLVINNGVRHAYQAWGREHAPEISLGQLNTIKIVKGAGTVRYGSDALGGVILTEPNRPLIHVPLDLTLGTGFQSNGKKISTKADFRQGFERFAWRTGIDYTKSGDLSAPDYELTNTGSEQLSYDIELFHHWPSLDLSLYYSRVNQELGILRGSITGNIEDLVNAIGAEVPSETAPFSYDLTSPRQEAIHDLWKAKASLFFGQHQLDIQYAFQLNQRKEFDVRRGNNNEVPAVNLRLFDHTLDVAWLLPKQRNIKTLMGVQLGLQQNDNLPGTNTIPFVPNYDRMDGGVYLISSLEKNNSVYEVGIRYDHLNLDVIGRTSRNDIYRNNLNYDNVTFSAGFTIEKGDFSWSMNLGTAWRAPNVAELYFFGRHQSNFQYGLWRYELFAESDSIATNRVLSAEDRPVKNESGIKWVSTFAYSKNGLRVEITPFINLINNYFFTRPYGITNTVRGPFPYFIYDQTDALLTGADVDVQLLKEHSEIGFKWSYVYARDITQGASFIEIPPMNTSIRYTRKLRRIHVGLEFNYHARQWNAPSVISPESFLDESVVLNRNQTFDFLAAPPGYLLMNSFVKYVHTSWTIEVGGRNILNSRYRNYTDRMRYFADQMGMNLYTSVVYRLSK